MGMLGALVCTRVYGIVRGSFDGAGRGTVLGGERGVGEGLDERWWGLRCVWWKGVKQDVMDVDSSSDEDEGKCEGKEIADSAPSQKQIQNKNIGAPIPPCTVAHGQASPADCA